MKKDKKNSKKKFKTVELVKYHVRQSQKKQSNTKNKTENYWSFEELMMK